MSGGAYNDGTLSFGALRRNNRTRCEQVFHKLHDWSPSDWAVATGGEIGEAMEAFGKMLMFMDTVKKLRRLDGADASKDTEEERIRLIDKVVEELADVVIYSDLLVSVLGRELGREVVKKFNAVSEKRGSTIFL